MRVLTDLIAPFLTQAKTTSQAIKQYPNEYQGLEVKVSFGKGHAAKVPWIAFLKEPNTVRSGIYPVYLLFRDQNLLILAYGVAEGSTYSEWKGDDLILLSDYFPNNGLGIVPKYGNSFFYKGYPVGTNFDMLDGNRIQFDLDSLIQIYNQQ